MKPLILFLSLLILTACQKQELIVERFPSGSPKLVYLQNGEKIPEVELGYFITNVRKYRVELLQKKWHGAYEEWNTEGQKVWDGFYENGEKNGEWVSWYGKGMIQEKGSYVKGKKEGQWEEYWANGTLKKTQTFTKGLKTGEEVEYRSEGKIKSKNTCWQKGGGRYIEWGEKDQVELEFDCENEKKTGVLKTYDEEGSLLSEEQYRLGKKNGEQRYYHKGGWVRRVENFQDGNRVGKQLHLRAKKDTLMQVDLRGGSGTLLYGTENDLYPDTSFVAGKIHGLLNVYTDSSKTQYSFERGELKYIEFFGKAEKYYLISKGGFKKGKKQGPWVVFQKQGCLPKEELNFQDGELFGVQNYYDSTGKLSMVKRFEGKNKPVWIDLQK